MCGPSNSGTVGCRRVGSMTASGTVGVMIAGAIRGSLYEEGNERGGEHDRVDDVVA